MLTLRNSEQILLTLLIPVALLVGLTVLDIFDAARAAGRLGGAAGVRAGRDVVGVHRAGHRARVRPAVRRAQAAGRDGAPRWLLVAGRAVAGARGGRGAAGRARRDRGGAGLVTRAGRARVGAAAGGRSARCRSARSVCCSAVRSRPRSCWRWPTSCGSCCCWPAASSCRRPRCRGSSATSSRCCRPAHWPTACTRHWSTAACRAGRVRGAARLGRGGGAGRHPHHEAELNNPVTSRRPVRSAGTGPRNGAPRPRRRR